MINAIIGLALAIVQSPAPAQQADDVRRIGLAWLDSTSGCANFTRSDLATGTRVTFVSVPMEGSSNADSAIVVAGEIVAPATSRDRGCNQIGGADAGVDAFYMVRLSTPAPPRGGHLALLALPQAVTRKGAATTVTLRPGAAPVALRACHSVEGVHLTVWQGEALKGRRLFHAYYGVGYDMANSSCTDSEMIRSARLGMFDMRAVASPNERSLAVGRRR